MIFLICVFSPKNISSQCGILDVGPGPTPLPSGGIGTEKKCIKLKFHFVKNGSAPFNTPSDGKLSEIVDFLNLTFGVGNINFKTDGNCLNEIDLPNITASQLSNQLIDPSTNKAKTGAPWFYDDKAVNIFFFNDKGSTMSNAPGFYDNNNEYLLADVTPRDVTHEMGHVFSLFHTHAMNIWSDKTTWECIGGSATKGDKISDTDADPRLMDIDGDQSEDGGKWELNCTHRPQVFDFPDACGNKNWNIPFDNMMSYYNDCRYKFSPLQLSAMYNHMINNFSRLFVECDNNLTGCNDIIINTPTVWKINSNPYPTGKLELCPNQKIIINPSGSLTLDAFTLTVKNNSPNCPIMGGLWDGIYIYGIGSGGSSTSNIPTAPSDGGFIKVLNGSVIEFSENGIQALAGHNGVTISGSIMRQNGMAVYSKGSGGSSFSSGVSISGSQISNSSRAKPVLLKMDGSRISVSSSNITNNGVDITGIKSYNGGVFIKEGTTINGCEYGIDKELNGGFGIGLSIQKSKITNCITAIRNTSSGVSAKFNYLDGFVKNFGKAYGTWFANNFRKKVTLDNPSLSHIFQENNFYKSELQINKNQSLTDARCNNWENSEQAVSGQPSEIKSEWGSQSSPSGNKWIDQKPIMEVYQCNQITNWQKFGVQGTYFDYYGQFIKNQNSFGEISCNYNLFPLSFGSGGGGVLIPYDDQSNRNLWTLYNNQFQTSLIALQNATGSQIAEYKSQNENAAVGMGQCVLNAWENFNGELNSETYNYWMARTDAIVTEHTNMIQLFTVQNYSALSNYLNSLSPTNEESSDRNVMIIASNWFANQLTANVNIYNLNIASLNYLTSLASSSFGGYTALLRSFLNIYYNIRIDPPQSQMPSIRSSSEGLNQTEKRYVVYPNPANDLITIECLDHKVSKINVSIYSLEGKKISEMKIKNSTPISIKGVLNAGVYIAKITNTETNETEQQKLIIN